MVNSADSDRKAPSCFLRYAYPNILGSYGTQMMNLAGDK